jgi:DNA-binding response OmpR family regulator
VDEINVSGVGKLVAPPCILVADDNADILSLNRQVLDSAGYRVDTAENGSLAWDALQAKSYDLLITDNDMPRMSGFELIEKLRAAGMTLPVIFVSGTTPIDAFEAHAWLTISARLPKPYAVADLLKLVAAILGDLRSA